MKMKTTNSKTNNWFTNRAPWLFVYSVLIQFSSRATEIKLQSLNRVWFLEVDCLGWSVLCTWQWRGSVYGSVGVNWWECEKAVLNSRWVDEFCWSFPQFLLVPAHLHHSYNEKKFVITCSACLCNVIFNSRHRCPNSRNSLLWYLAPPRSRTRASIAWMLVFAGLRLFNYWFAVARMFRYLRAPLALVPM